MSCHYCGRRTNPMQTYCSEKCAEDSHAQLHEDPMQYWGECEICASLIDEEKAVDKSIETDIDHAKHPEVRDGMESL